MDTVIARVDELLRFFNAGDFDACDPIINFYPDIDPTYVHTYTCSFPNGNHVTNFHARAAWLPDPT